MATVKEKIMYLAAIGQNPKASIAQTIKKTGKKAVGCFPVYCPEEIIYAAGYLPVGMWGGQLTGEKSDRYLQSFCCSIMKANTEQYLEGQYDFLEAIIMTAYCDTLKCIIENWKVSRKTVKLLPIVYAQNRKSQSGKIYMLEEFQRIAKELEELSGNKITEKDLTSAVDLYDEYRTTMQSFVKIINDYPTLISAKQRHLIIKASYFMDKKEYIARIKEIIAELKEIPPEEICRKRVVISGLICEPENVWDLFDENNLQVVGDDLAQESRQFRINSPKEGTAFERMVERVALLDGCSLMFDEQKSRGRRIVELKEENDADAVVFCQLKFCDPEEFDYPILKEELDIKEIPMLYMEIEQQMTSIEQLRTRVQSFAEMLS